METETAPGNEIGLPPAVNIPMAELPIDAEPATSNKVELSPVEDIPIAEPAVEPEVAPSKNAEMAPLAVARNPQLYSSGHPLFGASLFPLEQDSKTGTTAFAAPQHLGMRHPIAAVGLTIALAFLVSTGIFSYVCASRAGDVLFDWGEKMWGGAYSQPIPQNSASPARSLPDSSKPLQQ
jgi:hypothetical protein